MKPIVTRARRWTLTGLVASAIGTRVVEGGSDGSVAHGLLPVLWIAELATAYSVVTELTKNITDTSDLLSISAKTLALTRQRVHR